MTSKGEPGTCEGCRKPSWLMPLHGDKGGPLRCFLCAGQFHAKFTQQKKWGRIAAKAEQLFHKAGGNKAELDRWRLVVLGFDVTEILPAGYDAGPDIGEFTSELLADVIKLVHPDLHPPERKELAQRVTQALLALKPFVLPAPKPKPEPPVTAPRDTFFKETRDSLKKPSRPTYPCADCIRTVPHFYCDPCRTEWGKRQDKARERHNAKHRQWYAQRKATRHRQIRCAVCGEVFKPKRRDMKHCSAACRQRAYRQRMAPAPRATTPTGSATLRHDSNGHPLGPLGVAPDLLDQQGAAK